MRGRERGTRRATSLRCRPRARAPAAKARTLPRGPGKSRARGSPLAVKPRCHVCVRRTATPAVSAVDVPARREPSPALARSAQRRPAAEAPSRAARLAPEILATAGDGGPGSFRPRGSSATLPRSSLAPPPNSRASSRLPFSHERTFVPSAARRSSCRPAPGVSSGGASRPGLRPGPRAFERRPPAPRLASDRRRAQSDRAMASEGVRGAWLDLGAPRLLPLLTAVPDPPRRSARRAARVGRTAPLDVAD